MRFGDAAESGHAGVSAEVRREDGPLRVQVDFQALYPPSDDAGAPPGAGRGVHPEGMSVQKYVRVNGAPRRTSDLVGEVTATMFSADDLQLVYGPPRLRRRYLDILISQLNRRYLRALQRYQRVVFQRNHLLRQARAGNARPDEMEYWDGELVSEGAYVSAERAGALSQLSSRVGPIHGDLSGEGEALELVYRPSVTLDAADSPKAVADGLRQALEEGRDKEVAQGVTMAGPHRDDVQLLLNGVDVGIYASRGQSRTAVLSMRLAEAAYLADRRGQRPVLLLDDVLSELDAERRAHVLERASGYEQCFISTTDADSVAQAQTRIEVRAGHVAADR